MWSFYENRLILVFLILAQLVVSSKEETTRDWLLHQGNHSTLRQDLDDNSRTLVLSG